MLVKICGINKKEEADLAIEAGADALGFLVGITHLAEDKVSLINAKKIIKSTSNKVKKIMVTHLLDPNKIIKYCKYIKSDCIQLHDDVSVDTIRKIHKELPKILLIKAIHIDGRGSIKKAKKYEQFVDYLLLDTKSGNRIGGTGLTHNWDIDKEIVKSAKIPVILAGGLNPNNVKEAIQIIKPFAVDVNSGVENVDGTKNIDKMKKFIAIAKSTDIDNK